MREYRKVVTFMYKSNKYNMYLDENNKRFFLKVDDRGKFHYVTLNELIELMNLFVPNSTIYDANSDFLKEKIKIVPKVIKSGVAAVLSISLLTMSAKEYYEGYQEEINSTQTTELANEKEEVPKTKNNSLLNENTIQNYVSTSDAKIDNSKVDTYIESDTYNYIYIYDMEYLDKVYDDYEVSIEDLYSVIDNNVSISQKYKNLLYEYCNAVVTKYPNAEIRILYENLKTLKILDVTEEEISNISHEGSLGCYDREYNIMYMLDYYTYEKGSWQYEVFFHEMSHCLRTRWCEINGKDVEFQVEGDKFNNVISAEALNSLFAISLLPYREDNITYQLQSNYFNIMIECMDNYNLADYVNHSVSYFTYKLDEYNNDDNYAAIILDLIQIQYNEYHGINYNTIDGETNETYLIVDDEQYYPIYDYIAKMYYNKYITDDMTYDEMEKIADELINKISINIPENYNINYNYFYDYLDTHYNEVKSVNKTL